jgi:glutamyl-tRNA reductase
MAIVVIGVNHRTGSLPLLERLAIPADAHGKAIAGLIARQTIREAAVLSTCNRTEIYAVAELFHGAYADIRDFFCDLAGLSADDLHPHLYSQHDEAAVLHLFEVAAGLDSAVLGESEILGQVRVAWETAQAEGGAKATLNLLFRHAIATGKRARTETSIGRGTASVSHAAVEMATERLGSLSGRRVLVVGAGEMGEGVAAALVNAGANNIGVVNRTMQRADQLAQRIGGGVVPFDQLAGALSNADVLLTCTGAGGTLIDVELLTRSRGHSSSPLLVVDIAVPRDVAADVTTLPNVTLLNLDDLRDWAGRALALRAEEAQRVNRIVAEEVERFVIETKSRQAAPLVAQLRQRAEEIRRAELERFDTRLASLDPAQREAVDAVTKGIIAKLLHNPSVRLKDDAGTPQGERNADSVRDLFDLG